jgi:hypothetical protein
MRTLGLWSRPVGSTVNLKVTKPPGKAATYELIVWKTDGNSRGTVGTFDPATLQGTGAVVAVDPADLYELTLRVWLADQGDQSLQATLTDAGSLDVLFSGTVALPGSEGPVVSVEWPIRVVSS